MDGTPEGLEARLTAITRMEIQPIQSEGCGGNVTWFGKRADRAATGSDSLRLIRSGASYTSHRMPTEETFMTARGSLRKYTTAFIAVSLLASSAATAAPAARTTIDPLVIVSVFGTAQSRAAVCAAGAAQAAAAAGAAVAAQAGSQGCVLPVMDVVAPPPVAEALPPPALAMAPSATSGGVGVLPLLAGLAAIAAAAAILFKGSDDGTINLPIPPEGVPISP